MTSLNVVPQTLSVAVSSVELLATDIYKVLLTLPNDAGVSFKAGQYLEVLLEQGTDKEFGVPYSIASAPEADQIELHLMYQGAETLSARILELFQQQDEVTVTIAKGDCVFLPEQMSSDEQVLLIAAGTCFGQMKAMLEHGLAAGTKQPIHLYWGVRGADQLYFAKEAKAWAAEHDNVTFEPVVSEPDSDWQGRKGLVHEAVLADIADLSDYQVFVCGSPAMVYAVEDAFIEQGLREGCMHSDVFSYAPRPKKD